jgi:HEAT repeat protein
MKKLGKKRFFIAFAIIAVSVSLPTGILGAQLASSPPAGELDVRMIEDALSQVAAYSYGQDFKPLADVAAFARAAKANPPVLAQLESRLISFLKSDATADGKKFVCQQLSLVGAAASVPVLADMLVVPATSDMARYALERIEAPEAAQALRAALGKTSGKEQVGIIATLGRKRDPQSTSLLRGLISSPDAATASASLHALGDIGDVSAVEILAQARKGLSGPLRDEASDAYARSAEQAIRRGDQERALAAYSELASPTEPVMIQVAALRGIASIQGAKALEVVAKALQSGEPLLRAAAIQLLGALPGEEAGRTLIAAYAALPPAAKAQALVALVGRGEAAARPLLGEGLSDESPDVRVAALQGIGKMGDASQVMPLAQAAAERSDAEQAAARRSLCTLNAPDVDKTILDNLDSAAPAVKAELITAIGERRLEAAADTLVTLASDPDPLVSRQARRALAETAQPKHVAALIDLMRQSKDGVAQGDFQKALVATIRRHQMSGVDRVVTAAATPGEGRGLLLQTVGQLGDPSGLEVLRGAIKDPDPDIQRSAILAFGEWPTAEPMPELLEIAKGGSSESLQILALRSYLRLVQQPSARSRPETVKLLEQALQFARQDQEKRQILGILPRFACPEAVQLAESLKGTSVSREAEMALRRMSQGRR